MGFYLGIDPGSNGALAVLEDEMITSVFRLKNKTGQEVKDWLKAQVEKCPGLQGAIERLQPMPRGKTGVIAMFKMGRSYGHLLGLLDALEIRYRLIQSTKWQQALGCLTGGDKNISKERAHREWPWYKATHADSDALLITLWLSRECRKVQPAAKT